MGFLKMIKTRAVWLQQQQMHPAKVLNLTLYESVFVPFSSLFFPVVKVAKLHFNASFNR